jgi:TPR repeat protein
MKKAHLLALLSLGATTPILAVDCSIEGVISIDRQRESLKAAGLARLKNGQKNREGRYEFAPTPESEQKLKLELDKLIKDCADAGNTLATYIAGEDARILGEQQESVFTSFATFLSRNPDPSLAVQNAQLKRAADDSYREAVRWFEKSSAVGYIPAMFELAKLHRDGKGVSKSAFLAIEWFDRAARGSLANGSREAAARCLEEMTKISSSHPLTVRLTQEIYPPVR